MAYGNVPDDWGSYYSTCSLCDSSYHASEGGCGCTDDKLLCSGEDCGSENCLSSYHDADNMTEIGGNHYCEDCVECLLCVCCGTDQEVSYHEEAGELLCSTCIAEEHECPV
jgi:hypothetical protein